MTLTELEQMRSEGKPLPSRGDAERLVEAMKAEGWPTPNVIMYSAHANQLPYLSTLRRLLQ